MEVQLNRNEFCRVECKASSSPPRATLELNDSVDSTKDHVPDSDSGALQQMLTLDCFNFNEPVRQTRQKEVCNMWIFLFVSFNFFPQYFFLSGLISQHLSDKEASGRLPAVGADISAHILHNAEHR